MDSKDQTKDQLTNEQIRTRFVNQFDLVSHAIRIASNLIRTGREPRVATGTDNPALQALQEIKMHKDVIDNDEIITLESFTFSTLEKKQKEDRANLSRL